MKSSEPAEANGSLGFGCVCWFSKENGFMDVMNVSNIFSIIVNFTCNIMSQLLELEEERLQSMEVNYLLRLF